MGFEEALREFKDLFGQELKFEVAIAEWFYTKGRLDSLEIQLEKEKK